MVKNISKQIRDMSGEHSSYEIFSDWIKMFALTISNQTDLIRDGDIWRDREKQYASVAQKYSAEILRKFPELSGMLTVALEEDIFDALGSIYMEAGIGSKITGQFFTPFHLSCLCVAATISEEVTSGSPMLINEPSCGGGGMIIAMAKAMKDKGIDYHNCMEVTAQDLDWNCVYMTYIQLSLLGIRAVVAQGNTLSEPYAAGYPEERILRTPRMKGLLA